MMTDLRTAAALGSNAAMARSHQLRAIAKSSLSVVAKAAVTAIVHRSAVDHRPGAIAIAITVAAVEIDFRGNGGGSRRGNTGPHAHTRFGRRGRNRGKRGNRGDGQGKLSHGRVPFYQSWPTDGIGFANLVVGSA